MAVNLNTLTSVYGVSAKSVSMVLSLYSIYICYVVAIYELLTLENRRPMLESRQAFTLSRQF